MIAVDAMGGDYAPHSTVLGSYKAAQRGIAVTLFGQAASIRSLLNALDSHWPSLPISIVDCSESIAMDEEPSRAIRTKANSSLVKALHHVAQGHSEALVTAGHSGAALVGGSIILGKVPGLSRPAIGTFLPKLNDSVLCLDLGANADAKPMHLRQFAIMGRLFVRQQTGVEPCVALLSNGAERYKGSIVVKEAYDLLEGIGGMTFWGNIEPNSLFFSPVDVVVCDGFVGNIMLKAMEGSTKAMADLIQKQFSSTLGGKIIGLLSRPFLRKVKGKLDYTRWGGALLLGVRKPLVIAHGCSQAIAIENAIALAHKTVVEKVIEHFTQGLEIALAEHTSDKNEATLSRDNRAISMETL